MFVIDLGTVRHSQTHCGWLGPHYCDTTYTFFLTTFSRIR